MENNPYYNYYTVENQKLSTKLYAVLASKHLKYEYEINWHLPNFEKEFFKIDLLKEPEKSLDQLYKQRAEQLRNDYDYLILHYSGGHDSHNILETFMLNNIFIDEILILNQFDKSFRQKLENANFEFLHQTAYEAEFSAIPLAKHFIDTYSPKTKLTIVENSFSIHGDYWLTLTEKQMIENLKMPGTLGVIGKPPLRLNNLNVYNTDYRKIKETKKVAHIWGRDKCALSFDNIGYYFNFVDGAMTDYIDGNNNISKDQLLQNIEFFYTHPTTATMILKQAHTIMNKIPYYKLNTKTITRSYENMIANFIYSRKISSPYLGLKGGDFKNIINYLNRKRDSNRDLSLYNISELVLLKNMQTDIFTSFSDQINIIGNFLRLPSNQIEGAISANYATKKFYIKYFE